ncbi:MAG TPA: OsmC family protein, partial [Steroidobacteraceae bacterium]|nr:OsmC family protein [Steroidobacteraceae bacterium]
RLPSVAKSLPRSCFCVVLASWQSRPGSSRRRSLNCARRTRTLDRINSRADLGAIAVGFKFSWVSLDVRTEGTVDRSDGKMRFTKFLTHAKLRIAADGDVEKAKKLLEKAEASCLVTNSLSSDVRLTTEVTSG